MDREHPRDLFDVCSFSPTEASRGRSATPSSSRLASHDRPVHEALFSAQRDTAQEYERNFLGTTTEPAALNDLLATRDRMRREPNSVFIG